MTSEVVVMNSLGVALASDSAATVNNGEGDKVFNSADKLFMLSKRHPVGVMVYDNAALLGVPWETIIKVFRRQLGNSRFATLEEYGSALIGFLDRNERLFPAALQDRFYLRSIETLFALLENRIEDAIYASFVDGTDPPPASSDIARQIINKERNSWKSEAEASCLAEGVGARLTGRFSGEISKRIAAAFGPFRIDSETMQALYELARLIVSKERIPSFSLSGIVVAGFGEDEHFPVMQSMEIGDVFEGRLKYRCCEVRRIDCDTPSVIVPFADGDMVNTFLHGMNPGFELRMTKEIADLVTNLPDAIVDAIADLTDEQRAKWKSQFRPESKKAIKSLIQKLNEQREEKHLGPIKQAIANMPKDELGFAAARLVSLNWFQKRMSLSTETVGGPVDVAVISKGDGFIWIDRKHYFRPELNQHFFDNYHFDQETNGASHDQGEKARKHKNARTREKSDGRSAGRTDRAISSPQSRPRRDAD
ncbi:MULTISPECIES: hypothetical protein [unclassified Mesorhizobium]|uniref:hypothetical protein n=1 Tax=unclassified Mesorhizobium TaxID=325217 RepID=UPI0018EBA7F5|nr:hypothetical protein [Mesorhizobium sp. 131-3-5]BCH12713.1 hypothetical protein MesoLj131c_69710 [Mesorhizobium sp. 131-3-5]